MNVRMSRARSFSMVRAPRVVWSEVDPARPKYGAHTCTASMPKFLASHVRFQSGAMGARASVRRAERTRAWLQWHARLRTDRSRRHRRAHAANIGLSPMCASDFDARDATALA